LLNYIKQESEFKSENAYKDFHCANSVLNPEEHEPQADVNLDKFSWRAKIIIQVMNI